MSGNSVGAAKAVAKIKARDPDHFKKIGSLSQESWERNGRKPRGFSAMTPEKRSAAGRLGGSISKRTKKG